MEDAILNTGLPIALAIMMLGMGLGLTIGDFTRVFTKPKAFSIGVVLQIVMVPFAALAVVSVFPMAAPLAVGFMLLAACPGGVTSNILTYIGRGDAALSVSLTAVISLVGFITIPLITGWALGNFMGEAAPDLPLGETMIGILVITTVPVALGMLVRGFAPGFARKAERVFRPLSALIFVAVVVAAVYANRDDVVPFFAQAGVAALAMNLFTMIVAGLFAVVLSLPRDQRIAITLECGLQNSTIALVVALTFLKVDAISIPAAVYGLIMLATGFGYAWWIGRRAPQPA